jgi:hypothetical protein
VADRKLETTRLLEDSAGPIYYPAMELLQLGAWWFARLSKPN